MSTPRIVRPAELTELADELYALANRTEGQYQLLAERLDRAAQVIVQIQQRLAGLEARMG